MYRLISCFFSNTSAKNYCKWIVYVKVIENQRWDVFETQCRSTVTVHTYAKARLTIVAYPDPHPDA